MTDLIKTSPEHDNESYLCVLRCRNLLEEVTRLYVLKTHGIDHTYESKVAKEALGEFLEAMREVGLTG